MSRFDLTGRHVVVIGASRGIGAGTAASLADQGADLTLTASPNGDLSGVVGTIAKRGRSCRTALVDVTDATELDRVLAEADACAPVWAVVVVAGVSVRANAVDMADEDYRRIIETNVTGSWNAARAAGRVLLRRGEGSLVLFGSMTTHFGMNIGSAYAASKGAVAQLGKSLAIEWAVDGVRVNVVSPGFVATEMTAVSLSMPERRRWIMERTPMSRLGEPREIGDAVAFLVSPAASFITGQDIHIDGGFMAGSRW